MSEPLLAKPKKRPGLAIATVKAGEGIRIRLKVNRYPPPNEITAWNGRVIEVDHVAIRIRAASYNMHSVLMPIGSQGVEVIPWSRIASVTLIEGAPA